MIDPRTGEIGFAGEAATFGPWTTREAFVNSEIGRRSAIISQVHRDSFSRPTVEVHGHPFYRVLYFLGGKLYQVFMGSTHPQFGQSWNDWSQEKEMVRKKYHESVLATIFGSER